MKEFFVLIETDNENNEIYCECYSSRKKALEYIADRHLCNLEELIETVPELDKDEFKFPDEVINGYFYLKKFSIDQIQ